MKNLLNIIWRLSLLSDISSGRLFQSCALGHKTISDEHNVANVVAGVNMAAGGVGARSLRCFSITQRSVQIPIGPAPIIRTVSSSVISLMRAAQKPVAKTSPTNSACSSVTLSGIRFNPCQARGTRTYSACPPSILQPSAQPPTISWPTVMPGTALGMLPCLI